MTDWLDPTEVAKVKASSVAMLNPTDTKAQTGFNPKPLAWYTIEQC